MKTKMIPIMALLIVLCVGSLPAEEFTIIVLPDTQMYSEYWPQHFSAQTQWIKDNVGALNIKYVLHVGDVVDNNNTTQFDNAKAALSTLDGYVPYAIAPGNHDYTSTRDTLFLNGSTDTPSYFGVGTPYATQSSIGGFYVDDGTVRTDNSWHTFSVAGEDFLVIALEFGPRDPVVTWAESIVAAHPAHHTILITHAYMYHDDTRYDWATKGTSQASNPHNYSWASLPGGVNDGEELWQKMVKKYDNFIMTISGHVLGDGAGRLASIGDNGNLVHQILNNYQMREEGGEGYLRIYTFKEDKDTIEVETYSPVLDQYLTDGQQQFTLKLSPPELSLVAHYDFEGDASDVSGNGHHGTIVGAGSIIDDPDRGLVFENTSGYIDIHSTVPIPAFQADTSITIAAWVKQAQTPTSDYTYVIQVGSNGDNPIAALGVLPDGGLVSYSETDQPGLDADQVNVYSDAPIETGAPAAFADWHHLAVVYDRSIDIATTYIDGVAAGTTDISLLDDTYGFTWANGRIGSDSSGSTYYVGLIDEVCIYSDVLSESEIASIMMRTSSVVAYYDFEGDASDLSGYGHHGSIVGAGSIIDDPDRGLVFENTSGYIDIHSTVPIPAFPADTSITLAAWVKQAQTPTSSYTYVIQLGRDGDNPNATLSILPDGRIRSYSETDQPGANADQVSVSSDGPIETGAPAAFADWHHLAVVYDRSIDIATTYIDGVAAGVTGISLLDDTYGFTWTSGTIGSNSGGSTYYVGMIDDVYIYSKALSESKIADLAANNPDDFTPPTPDPMTWATVPYATGSSSITMVATTASDPSGVKYYFTCTAGGGNDSGWQGSTSYTDTGLTPETTYTYTVIASDKSVNQNTTAASTAEPATTGPQGDVDDVANGQIPVAGTVSGTYTDTQTSNNGYESITEIESGGKPANRYSYLEHKWTINVTGGNTVTFFVEAYQSASSDGDNFVFAYSTNDSTYTDMVTVTKTSDDNNTQSYALPSSTSGTVYIRVKDTDQAQGNRNLDTINIDHLFIRSAAGGEPDTDPPTPNPATFASPPAAVSDTEITMTATTASDPSGVQYYFTCTVGGGNDSGWQSNPAYTDTGLTPDTPYTYTVTACDNSPAQNQTDASTAESATTGSPEPDTDPPTPDPMTWATLPYPMGSSSISMTATTASDPSGIQYYFTCTVGGGNNSGWQSSPAYNDTGLTPDTPYTYTVTACDNSPAQNQTDASTAESATTGSPDTDPPTPDPMTWATLPYPMGSSSISMTATTASDPSGVQYYFTCTVGGGNDSGWQSSPAYNDTGLTPDTPYTYTVTACDNSPAQNQTAASTAESATTGSAAAPIGWWELDETTGTTASDSSSYGYNGTLIGGVTFDNDSVTGKYGGALNLDGTDDSISLPAFNLNSNTVTITAWVKTNGTPSSWNGIVFSRGGSTAAGLSFGTGTELRYNWNEGQYGWDSGLNVPNAQWTFVALVVEPTKATIYMDDGTFQSSTNTVSHAAEEFDGITHIGWDSNFSERRLDGAIDDVRIYSVALSSGDIEIVRGDHGGGEPCTPTDMHIEAVVCATVACGGPNKNGQATVTIYDDCGNPVTDALVDGTFTGDYSESFYDVQTDQYGEAVFTTAGCIKKPAFTFTVTDVTDSLPYDSNDDVTDNCSG